MKENQIETIENLIVSNKLEEALKKLKIIFKEKRDNELLNESILSLSRLHNFKIKSNQGVVDYFDPEYTKIQLATLNLKNSAEKLQEKKNTNSKPIYEIETSPIFEENFIDNSNNWFIGSDEIAKAEIKNERYFSEHLRNQKSLLITQNIDIDTSKNFSIKTGILFLRGKDVSYGLTWGGGKGDGNTEFYLFIFAISPKGEFKISYFVEDKEVIISDWTKNSAIKNGINTNVFEIIKNLNLLHFKINNEVVFTSEFISFFGNKVGIIHTKESKVAIDYIVLKN